ncbi:MAG: CRTAC1 family protein, partial [Myxococcales bacterium]|nr:CRTAC1 family protein [Myxococcales bacterium]
DLDNDGWLDFYAGTGDPDLRTLVPNKMYHNVRGRFVDVTAPGGFGHIQKGHGIAFGDVDLDGDQDILDNQGGAYAGDTYPKALFLNPGNANRWITLILEGTEANRGAVGTRLRLEIDTPTGPRQLFRTVGVGSSFGGNSLRQEIGLGDATAISAVELRWPGGEPLTRTPQAFLGFLETGSWSAFFDSAATVMHESAHGFHADNGLWQQRTTCYIRGDLHIAVDIIPTPARSLIRARLPDDSTRLYAGTYLTGEQGQRGFFEILEELNCYVMDMTTYAVFGDELDILGVSGRDGAVSFFLFLQIYLGALRAEQPATWQQICDQPAVRQFIDVEWRAMHFWLAIADRYPALGIHDGEVRRHLYQADRMGELAACLGFALEAGPCRDRQPGE